MHLGTKVLAEAEVHHPAGWGSLQALNSELYKISLGKHRPMSKALSHTTLPNLDETVESTVTIKSCSSTEIGILTVLKL